MIANVPASSSIDLWGMDAFCRVLTRSPRLVDAVDSGRHTTNTKNATDTRITAAHADTMTTRCVVQNVSSIVFGVGGGVVGITNGGKFGLGSEGGCGGVEEDSDCATM